MVTAWTDKGAPSTTTTIAGAIDDLPSTGGRVWIDPGTYEIDTAITPISNLYLKGAGIGNTILQASTAMTAIIYGSTSMSNIIIEDMTIDTNNQASTSGIQFNGAAFENIYFKRCEFINGVGAWQLLVGYISDATAETWVSEKSFKIHVEECYFEGYSSSTLEQAILVNCADSSVRNCRFADNSSQGPCLAIYGHGRNINISENSFINSANVTDSSVHRAMYVQASDNITIEGNHTNYKRGESITRLQHGIEVINCTDVSIIGNTLETYYTTGNAGVGIRIYDYVAEDGFDGHDHQTIHYDTKNVSVVGNTVNGYFYGVWCPAQQTSSHTQDMSHIVIADNVVQNCQGIPFDIGSDTNTGVNNITLSNNIVESHRGADYGAIRVRGASGAALTQLAIIGNTIPGAAAGANQYGIYGDYVQDYRIIGNDVSGLGTRSAIHMQNDNDGIIYLNNINDTGITYSMNRGFVDYNIGAFNSVKLRTTYVGNATGGDLVAGNVVTLAANASGYNIGTTTTQGDDLVFGMLISNITNGSFGYCLTEGKTTILKVDGTTDIAVGDYLCTFTTAGIAAKAGSGDMVFAIALEAYATNDSNGTIAALLITPRKI